MAVQETTTVATMATRACSPGHLDDPLYKKALEVKDSGSNEEMKAELRDKKKRRRIGTKQDLKENALGNPHGPLLKSDEPHKKMGKKVSSGNGDDLLDIYISDEVMKQLRSNTEDKDFKHGKQTKRRQSRSQRKTFKNTGVNNKEETDQVKNEESKKKLHKTSMSRKSNLSINSSKFLEDCDEMELFDNNNEKDGNKAENNNWMVDDDKSRNIHNGVVQQFYTSRQPTFIDSMLDSADGMCMVGSLKKLTLQQSHKDKGTMELEGTKGFERADSSDDSGCFSNVSVKSSGSADSHKREVVRTDSTSNPSFSDESKASSANKQVSTGSSGLCSVCGHEPQGNGSGLCKTCISRIKNEGTRIGTLGELKAYAQSIAHSVKKILSITPRQSHEVLEAVISPKSGTECTKLRSQPEIKNIPNNTRTQLQNCKMQISLRDDLRGLSLTNKSGSFDTRVVAHLDENCRDSPVYWSNQDKAKLPISSSTLFEYEEDKLRSTVQNASDLSIIDGDYFPWNGKELKSYTGQDDGNGSSTMEKTRRKSYMKQISCIERMRPDGDARGNYHHLGNSDRKYGADESKKIVELRRSRNRIPRGENVEKSCQKPNEEMNALNVFRLKVIHEGSPVDPLYTVLQEKCDDYKEKRAVLMRSATAPYKNNMPKKDGSIDDGTGVTKERAKRSNTKLELKTNQTLIPKIEEKVVEDATDKHQSMYEGYLESWKDDTCVMSVTPVFRRRSTSYDGRRTVSSKRNELHRSISRPPVDREDKGNKQRRRVISREKACVRIMKENDGRYITKTEHSFKYANRSTDDNQTDVSPKRGVFIDNYKSYAVEPCNSELCYHVQNDHKIGKHADEEPMQIMEASNKSYYNDEKYYSQRTENQFSSTSGDFIFNKRTAELLNTGSYYSEIDDLVSNSHLFNCSHVISKNIMSPDNSLMFKGIGDYEEPYHNQIQKYGLNEKDNVWYNPQSEKRALVGSWRDSFYESKSSTSFHKVTTARSSHSDVALFKYQNSLDYAPSRRQTMYSETDVDTGLIYHFAKRQTRAHVPTYHDLTSSSKDIYTMSGDVSRSASSNSSVSTVSEVSDSDYTGGFYSHDLFYNNDTSESSSKSKDSHSHLYFEPSIVTKRELSELDIYTGAIFSSSQNALSLGRSVEDSKKHSLDELKDGSTNNSTRPPLTRMSRRIRYRPHIDVIEFKMAQPTCEHLPRFVQQNNEVFADMSNNSSSWSDTDNAKDSIYQGPTIKTFTDPSYAEYKKVVTESFRVKTIVKPAPVVDLMKYDNLEVSNNYLFYTTPSRTAPCACCEGVMYSGFTDHAGDEFIFDHNQEQNDVGVSFSWQRQDEYYKSAQRPIVNKTNNCYDGDQELFEANTNNNRFEDFYTGFFEPPATKPNVQEQVATNTPKPSTDNWYLEQPKRHHSAADFYGDDFSKSETCKKPADASGPSDRPYSSNSVFGQANAAYSGSRAYMKPGGWGDYGKMDMSSSNNYVDEPPKLKHPMAAESSKMSSYFQYTESPAEGAHRYDKKAYGFEQATPSPVADPNEIRKVGGIVCRENVVNKEDYAEDVNRDLEQGAWMPFNFKHEEKSRHQEDASNSFSNRSEAISETQKVPAFINNDKHQKHVEESSYNQDRIYDNVGARNKWREMKTKSQPSVIKKREQSPKKAHSTGDAKKQEYIKTGAWNPPDQIPDKARGKRPVAGTSKSVSQDGSKGSVSSLNVISSVASIPSRLTNYVRRWF